MLSPKGYSIELNLVFEKTAQGSILQTGSFATTAPLLNCLASKFLSSHNHRQTQNRKISIALLCQIGFLEEIVSITFSITFFYAKASQPNLAQPKTMFSTLSSKNKLDIHTSNLKKLWLNYV